MPTQSALDYIRRLRDTQGDVPDSIDSLVEQARVEGYDFTEDDLRAAFRSDWAMRWAIESRRLVDGDPDG